MSAFEKEKHMNCPSCATTLTIADRSGIEIDFCPSCRGVWLDRGELDKLIERSASFMSGGPAQAAPVQQAAPAYAPAPPQMRRDYDDDDDDYKRRQHYGDSSYGYKKKSKTKSMLGEIFDF